MYCNQFYRNMSQEKIEKSAREEGFDPIIIANGQNYIYQEHSHKETKLLAFLKGSMEVTIKGEKYNCVAGDKLIVLGNTDHSAKVGNDGCVFFWSEKVM